METELNFLKIEDLYKLHIVEKKLIVDRKYQRASNWDKDTQKLFIDSILRGYPIPLIYIHKQNDKYYIIDGQQRINAIIVFLENNIRLLSPNGNPKLFPQYLVNEECDWSGKRFNELSNDKQELFKNTFLSVALVEEVEDREVRNLFVRLQKGKPLTPQQVRDTSISGINDFILKIGGKNDLQNNVEFVLTLEGTDGTPNGHDFFNKSLKITRTDRGQTRQLAAQLLMLYLEMINNDRIVTINSSNIDDFYLKNLDFDAESDVAKDFEEILDILYNCLDETIRLENYEAIHLLLFTKKLKDLGVKDFDEKLNNAFIIFRNKLSEARKNETGEYWFEFGTRTGSNAAKDTTILKRHSFFVDKMLEFMFGGYTMNGAKLSNIFDVNIIVTSKSDKELIEAIRIFIPQIENPYLPNMVKAYFKYWNNKINKERKELRKETKSRPNQSNRQSNKDANIDMKTLIDFINECIEKHEEFIMIYQIRTTKTKIRKLVAQNKNELFTNRPDLVEKYSTQLNNKWWIGTNNSNKQNTTFYNIAEDVIEGLRN